MINLFKSFCTVFDFYIKEHINLMLKSQNINYKQTNYTKLLLKKK